MFDNIPVIPFEGAESKNPLAFKFYNPEQLVMGKPMKEYLPFAMAWWHNLGAAGTDMFGRDTADKSFGAEKGTMAHAKAKVDAGFEFMQKLGIDIRRSKLCGGGAKAPIWRKMMADILNIEIDIPQTEEGPGYGGAMLAMVGCGAYASVKACADALVSVTETVQPDSAVAALYEERYQKFKSVYPALKSVFKFFKEEA